MQVRPLSYEPQPPAPASGPGFAHALERVRATGAVLPPSANNSRATGTSRAQLATPPATQMPGPPGFLDQLLGWLYRTVRDVLGLLWSGLGEIGRWLRL